MKSNAKSKIIILITLGIIFIFSLIITTNLSLITSSYNKNSDYSDDNTSYNENLKISKISEKIHIDNNWTAAKSVGIVTGSGTYSDPYIIEDLVIDAGGSGSGILIENSDVYFKIENCTVYNSGLNTDAGIKMNNVNNSQLLENSILFNQFGIFLNYSYDNLISGNLITNNSYFGIALDFSDNNIITENRVKNHTAFSQFGISLSISKYNLISDNLVQYNYHGIGIVPRGIFPLSHISYNNTIWNNTVNYNEVGIYLSGKFGGCQNNTILENNVNSNNEYGIQVIKSKGIDIKKNLIYNNLKDGLFIVISDNCEIINNTIENNENNGINAYYSHDNLYIRNVIRNNLKIGISFAFTQYSNLLYENWFIENTINAQDNGTDNQWDNGITGNYWDDYSGSDADGNGIGDVPYYITGSAGSQDNFPLIKYPGSTPQEGGGIPGYNLFLLLGILSIVVIILRKKIKRLHQEKGRASQIVAI